MELRCKKCDKTRIVDITFDQFKKIQFEGKLVQEVIPHVEPALREMFISGICPDCWKEIFGESDDDTD